MSRGRSNKIVGQTGEYLVAAELSRRGLICTTFTGNVPHYDLIASNEAGEHISVQVKASMSGSWQFANVSDYCDIKFRGPQQIVGRHKSSPIKNLVVVFVKIDKDGRDEFYVLTWEELRALILVNYTAYLAKHAGVRPKNHRSLHVGVRAEHLLRYRDNWDIVQKRLSGFRSS
jgi:hypothetical protein